MVFRFGHGLYRKVVVIECGQVSLAYAPGIGAMVKRTKDKRRHRSYPAVVGKPSAEHVDLCRPRRPSLNESFPTFPSLAGQHQNDLPYDRRGFVSSRPYLPHIAKRRPGQCISVARSLSSQHETNGEISRNMNILIVAFGVIRLCHYCSPRPVRHLFI